MSTNALVLLPFLKNTPDMRDTDARLDEAISLTKAIELNVIYAESIAVREIKVKAYLGEGTIDRLKNIIDENEVDVVILACHLSPLQQRNLEKAWNTKVIDKTALILEIFGERARTKEGVLQVELAHLMYARSRLVRSWTHLERQRGGSGFLGGPGETQIELDRRLIDDDIIKIKKELEEVKKTRELHRQARRRVPYPIVALVGYTNAGKSTLFNRLTRSDVFAKDLLFATLDPTMRQIRLPNGQMVILSDTVGFISDLPTELIMAFRATLEEVLEADVIIHVRDFSHPDTEAQKKDVEDVLKGLGLSEAVDKGLLEALNKIDLLDEEERHCIINRSGWKTHQWPISAVSGQGIEDLLIAIQNQLTSNHKKIKLRIPIIDGSTLATIYRKGQVLERWDTNDYIDVVALVAPTDIALFDNFRFE